MNWSRVIKAKSRTLFNRHRARGDYWEMASRHHEWCPVSTLTTALIRWCCCPCCHRRGVDRDFAGRSGGFGRRSSSPTPPASTCSSRSGASSASRRWPLFPFLSDGRDPLPHQASEMFGPGALAHLAAGPADARQRARLRHFGTVSGLPAATCATIARSRCPAAQARLR